MLLNTSVLIKKKLLTLFQHQSFMQFYASSSFSLPFFLNTTFALFFCSFSFFVIWFSNELLVHLSRFQTPLSESFFLFVKVICMFFRIIHTVTAGEDVYGERKDTQSSCFTEWKFLHCTLATSQETRHSCLWIFLKQSQFCTLKYSSVGCLCLVLHLGFLVESGETNNKRQLIFSNQNKLPPSILNYFEIMLQILAFIIKRFHICFQLLFFYLVVSLWSCGSVHFWIDSHSKIMVCLWLTGVLIKLS